ncbi:MAG TPA: hypothetical protein VFD09_04225, partial [Thiopseudomonas sp.]|nr:hypothetical protein [Thiopseudomonas sp.]
MSQSIRWQILLVFAVLAALLLWFVSGPQSQAIAKSSSLHLAEQVHSLPDVSGAQPAVGSFDTRKPTLVKLWASWCPLCLSELGQTEEWVSDADFATANLLTVASPGVLGEQPL